MCAEAQKYRAFAVNLQGNLVAVVAEDVDLVQLRLFVPADRVKPYRAACQPSHELLERFSYCADDVSRGLFNLAIEMPCPEDTANFRWRHP